MYCPRLQVSPAVGCTGTHKLAHTPRLQCGGRAEDNVRPTLHPLNTTPHLTHIDTPDDPLPCSYSPACFLSCNPVPGKTIGKVIPGSSDAPSAPALCTTAYAATLAGSGSGSSSGSSGNPMRSLMSRLNLPGSKSGHEGSDASVTMSPVTCDVITLLCHGINDRKAVEVRATRSFPSKLCRRAFACGIASCVCVIFPAVSWYQPPAELYSIRRSHAISAQGVCTV